MRSLRTTLGVLACVMVGLAAHGARASDEPVGVPAVPSGVVEPIGKGGSYVHYKSPGPGMTFTVGIPLRVLADGIDPAGWQWKSRKSEAAEVRFIVDGQVKASVPPAPDGNDYFETTFKDLAVGPHLLALESSNYGGVIAKSLPIQITVEAMPAHAGMVDLKEDLVLTGATNLTWDNATIKGNGFQVRSAPNWTGSILIRNSFVTGLGDFTKPGIDLATSAGAAAIQDSVFEGTGAVFLKVNGAGAIEIRNNEFRSSNFVKFVANNPERSPVLRIMGNASGAKHFQSNRVGAGIVRFEGMSNWLIGGSTDAESNIMIGPRCVLQLISCRDMQVRGNYIHHDYNGGWSQGFNLYCEKCENILAEHNVIRHASWPVDGFTGELRYNLIVDSGHNWVRVVTTGSKIHHNLFIHTSGGGDVNSGFWLYNNRTDVAVYNNTFDAGAPLSRAFANPIIEISTGCSLSTLRNNIFTGLNKPENGSARPLVDRGKGEKVAEQRIAYADYNCFFNPQAPAAAHYAEGIAPNAGAHDVSADPKFVQGAIRPYPINQAEVWNRTYKVSQVLAYFRQRYTPAPGSPLLGAGDPADGPGSFIGAVGPGGSAPNDLFGRFSQAAGATGE